ncbi:MAG: aldo/keto reductase [Desulforhopalus sp.]
MKTLEFINGDQMPILGLGTWKSTSDDVYEVVKEALILGYRHIDCAAIYGNEPGVGQALRDTVNAGVVKREELWVTSKLWNNAHAPEDVQPTLEKTLSDLSLDYLDLYLMHWPIAYKKHVQYHSSAADFVPIEDLPISDTWEEMEKAVGKGLCKHIGVSNFSIKKLEALLQTAKIKPEMNQLELHPYLQQPAMLEFCQRNSIYLTGYAPLGSSDRPDRLKVENEPILLNDPVIEKIADRNSISPAQVLLSWAVNRGTSVIPKSVKKERLQENLEAAQVSLSEQDLAEIAALDMHRRYISGTFWAVEGGPYTLENLWDE